MADGEHTVTALVDYVGESDAVLQAVFDVDNATLGRVVLWVSAGPELPTPTTAPTETATTEPATTIWVGVDGLDPVG